MNIIRAAIVAIMLSGCANDPGDLTRGQPRNGNFAPAFPYQFQQRNFQSSPQGTSPGYPAY